MIRKLMSTGIACSHANNFMKVSCWLKLFPTAKFKKLKGSINKIVNQIVRRSVNQDPNPDPHPNQAPQMSLKEA